MNQNKQNEGIKLLLPANIRIPNGEDLEYEETLLNAQIRTEKKRPLVQNVLPDVIYL